MKLTNVGRACLIAALLSSTVRPAYGQSPPSRSEEVYIYFFDEVGAAGAATPPAGVLALHGSTTGYQDVFRSCAPAATPQIAPFLVPLVLFGFNLFARVVERVLSASEQRRLEALSRTFAQVRSDPAFPTIPAGQMRCLIVERVTRVDGSYELGATYVMGLRRTGDTAFTIEPVAARVDASGIIGRERPEKLNVTVSVAFQSVITDGEGTNQLVTLPAYSMNFKDLELRQTKPSSTRRSPVMPVAVSRTAAGGRPGSAPTSIAVSVTEAHGALDRVKQQIALDLANRAALVAAIGETIKSALTD